MQKILYFLSKKGTLMKRLVMEFLGTFLFILTIAITGHPLAIAAMLMAVMYIGGYISGGHYNPAISFGMFVSKRMTSQQFGLYSLAQILGSLVAFAFSFYIYGNIHMPAPGQGINWLQALLMEVLLAFVLVLVVLTVMVGKRFKGSHVFGFAIGFTIPALVFLGAPISGGVFNPALAIGSSFFGALKGYPLIWEHLLVYVFGALLGGYLAAWAFNYLVPADER